MNIIIYIMDKLAKEIINKIMLSISHPVAELYYKELYKAKERVRVKKQFYTNIREERIVAAELYFEEYGEYPEEVDDDDEEANDTEYYRTVWWLQLASYVEE